ncbi:MAG: hypothetical protein OEU92_00845 [Alphaproteobacteria bacterium]|nr:hypothetical protein [Alphaproteobacteria bacterium]
MDDILKSIRRIIRSDQDEAGQEKKMVQEVQQTKPVKPVVVQEESRKDDDNLIRMEIHDQKRLRILEKKLRTIETEYEQKVQLHRRKMTDYRRQNQELTAAVDSYKSKLELMSSSLKTAHDCLEKLQVRNKALKNKVLQMARFEQGTAVLQTIKREFSNLYHPDRVEGDNISRTVRHEVYNEFSQVLQGVQSRFQTRRM